MYLVRWRGGRYKRRREQTNKQTKNQEQEGDEVRDSSVVEGNIREVRPRQTEI